ncbi:MAG: UTP--glucose-1-phosphate uridylyltransferase GalU [Clostridia bacterium]|nr:UTP--glucose-1-phosphate uridylyltransferase GalU [Clostridia bacterium]
MKVTKAIIPAAGLGTRVLPASKSVPKEMLPIVDKPAIQYIVEECAAAGITDILIITNRGKNVIEDHFDHSFELETNLRQKGKLAMLEEVSAIADIANIHYIRQKETKGLGHAVLCAKAFVGNEPFAVCYGDDVIMGDIPAIGELAAAYEKYGKGVCGVKPVSAEAILKYSSLKVEPLEERVFRVTDMIEKPTPDKVMSPYSILGRVILPPEIFDYLEKTQPGAGGEIQLTDAMRQLALDETMVAVDFSGKRYDMGNKLGIMMAQCETALKHKEIGEDFREYLKKLAETL